MQILGFSAWAFVYRISASIVAACGEMVREWMGVKGVVNIFLQKGFGRDVLRALSATVFCSCVALPEECAWAFVCRYMLLSFLK